MEGPGYRNFLRSPPFLGLWAEIGLNLAIITLFTIVLNLFVIWRINESEIVSYRTDLASSLTESLKIALEKILPKKGEILEDEEFTEAARSILESYRLSNLPLSEVEVVDSRLRKVLILDGEGVRRGKGEDAGRDRDYILSLSRENPVENILARDGGGFGKDIYRITTPLLLYGRPRGALRVNLPLRPQGRYFVGQKAFFLYIILDSIVIGLFGYFLFSRRLVAPLRRLAAGIEEMRQGEFGAKVEIEGPREIAALTISFNEMVNAINRYREDLEEKIRSLRELNEKLEKAKEDLIISEKMAGVGRLATGIAHEIGNPLSAILGYTEVMEKRVKGRGEETAILGRVKREIDRIDTIITELLNYAKPRPKVVEEFEFKDTLEEVRKILNPQSIFRDIEIMSDIEEGMKVRGDRFKLKQVLINLLVNAAHAMKGKGVMKVSARRVEGETGLRDALSIPPDWRSLSPGREMEGGGAAISIHDTGTGIPDDDMKDIFDPFFTTKETGAGMGLGLTVVLSIVEAMGGKVRVFSKWGEGSIFSVLLPLEGPGEKK